MSAHSLEANRLQDIATHKALQRLAMTKLSWNPVPLSKNHFAATFEEGENHGVFEIKRVPRRKKDAWQARFAGSLRTGPATHTRERQQNFLASEEMSKAVCEGWASGKTIGSCLIEINREREAKVK